MKILIYLNKEDYNDATSHYMGIVISVLKELGLRVEFVDSWRKIKSDNYVMVISYRAFFYTYCLSGCSNIIFWFQGILPEEIKLLEKGVFGFLKRCFYSRLEKAILKKSLFLFFVSKAMQIHFVNKWGYKKNNYVVMPCFNKEINKQSFGYQDKYLNPTFVYTGSFLAWQCIEETLILYKEIENHIPNAKILIFTLEKEKARNLVTKMGIKNAEIDYLPIELLNDELQKYKYAFLLRKNIKVNNVATPTKMNTYLANGLIPIYSDVIEAFQENFRGNDFFITVNDNLDIPRIIEKIKEMENNKIDVDTLYNSYNEIFQTFYNEEHYKDIIRIGIKKIIKGIE